MKYKVLSLLLLVALLCTACGGGGAGLSEAVTNDSSSGSGFYYGSSSPDSDYSEIADIDQSRENQKWVVTMDLRCETLDYTTTYWWVKETIGSVGGYMEDEEEWGSERRYAEFTIRLPVSISDSFVSELSERSNITRRTEHRENVTVQYADTENYIKSLRVEQERLMELLEHANSVDDIITVQDRLTSVRTSIEGAEYRLRSLNNQIDFATITLRLEEVIQYTRTPSTFVGRAIEGFKENFSDVIEFVLNFLLWLIIHIPTLVLLFCIFFPIAVYRRKHRTRPVTPFYRKRGSKTQQTESERRDGETDG